MPLQKQKIHLPLSGGERDDIDDLLVAPPEMQTVQNLVQDKTGVWQKKYGMTTVSSGGNPLGGKPTSLFVRQDQLCMRGTPATVAYSEDANGWQTADIMPIPPTEMSREDIYHGRDVFQCDVAVIGDYTCYAWVDRASTKEVWVAIVDSDSSYAMQPTKTSGATSEVTVHGLATKFVILAWGGTASSDVVIGSIDTTSIVEPSFSTLTTAGTGWDATDDGTHVWFVGQSSTTYEALKVDEDKTTVDSFSGTGPTGSLSSVYVNPDAGVSGLLYAVSISSNTVYINRIDLALTGPWAGLSSLATGVTATAGTVSVYKAYVSKYDTSDKLITVVGTGYDDGVGTGYDIYCTEHIVSSDDVGTPAGSTQDITWGMWPSVRPEFDTGANKAIVGLTYQTAFRKRALSSGFGLDEEAAYDRALVFSILSLHPDQTSYQLVSIGRALVGFSQDIAHSGESIKASSFPVRSGNKRIAAVKCLSPTANLNTSTEDQELEDYGVVGIELDTYPGNQLAAPAGKTTLLEGGQVSVYDGVSIYENSYPFSPVIYDVAPSGSSSGPYDDFVDHIIVLFWRDAQGQIHRSAPSQPITVDYTANKYSTVQIDFLIPASFAGIVVESESAPFVACYMREGNDPYALLHQTEITPVSGDNWKASFTFSVRIVSAGGGTMLYTDGGVLPSDAPPAMKSLRASSGRIWGIPVDAPWSVMFTKPLEANVAPEWSFSNQIYSPDSSAKYTAIGEMDDKVLLFKENSIEVVYDNGPDATGSGSFQGPEDIMSDVGCVNRHSVVKTPAGVVFQSNKGLHIVDRSLQVKYIGGPIEDLLGTNLITSAVLVPDRNEARFLVSVGLEATGETWGSGSTDSVLTLVYNYGDSVWSYFSDSAEDGILGVVWKNRYTVAEESYSVSYEDTSSYFDAEPPGLAAGEAYFTTGWISPDGISGFARLWKVILTGQYYTGSVQVRVAYDHESGYTDSFTWSESELTNPLEISFKPSRQKCKAFRLEVSIYRVAEGASETLGKGTTFSGLTLEVGVKKPAYKHINTTTQK